MKNHYIVFSSTAEIVNIRSKQYFLSKIKREASHISSQPVYDIYLTSCTEDYLQLSVCKIIHIMSSTAYPAFERNTPEVFSVFIPQTERLLSILIECIHLSGVGILSLSGGWGMSAGDILTVLSGVPCAINMVITGIVSRNRNVLLLTTIELWVVAVFAGFFVLFGKSFPAEFPASAVGGIVYLGLIATALCLFLQSYGLKYAEPAIGGMLISLESVFGVLFSVVLYHEKITLRMLTGFAVIFLAILLSQWDGKKKKA